MRIYGKRGGRNDFSTTGTGEVESKAKDQERQETTGEFLARD